MFVWAEDFSYAYYRRLLGVAQDKFKCFLVGDASSALEYSDGPRLIMRHDIDVSLQRALDLAKIEKEMGVRATYMVIPNCLLYSIEDSESHRILQQLLELGHEIGLHFDLPEAFRQMPPALDTLLTMIENDCTRLEAALGGVQLRSVSFHRPIQALLRGPFRLNSRINAYAAELFGAMYLSDSKGVWSCGEPIPLLRGTDSTLIQLLTHPIWWREAHMPAADRLEQFFQINSTGKPDSEVNGFDRSLAATVPGVRRSGLTPEAAHDSRAV